LAFSPDSSTLAVAGLSSQLALLHEGTSEVRELRVPGPLRAVAFAPSGARLATGADDGEIRIWDSQQGTCLYVLTGHKGAIRRLAFSADGRLLVSASFDKTARIWDAASGRLLHVLEGHGDRIFGLALSSTS